MPHSFDIAPQPTRAVTLFVVRVRRPLAKDSDAQDTPRLRGEDSVICFEAMLAQTASILGGSGAPECPPRIIV